MGASLHDVADRADAIASGDLSLDELGADGTEQIERLSGAMNRMQKYLRETIGALAGSSNSLTISADNMRVCRDEVYKKIDLQSQQTQQAATAMAEMSASLAEVSRHTQEAATTSREAAKTARGGGDFVNNMLHVMDSQWGMVSSTADTMAKLNEDAGRISRIVSVIGDIARKTNLLALNAAIEAARAGEQGRGFAVVAGEVRRLAESTATAAGEIAGMIGDVQRQTNEALKLVDAGRNGVGTLVEATKKAGASLEGIIGMAERVEQMIAQIAIATQQQEAVATQSSASLDAIHALSDGSLVEMASSAEYVERVRATARDIERQTERFLLVPVVPETFGAGPAGYPPIPFAVPKRGPMRLQTVGKQPRH
jgi:methyl-accepting chemotaxis protein